MVADDTGAELTESAPSLAKIQNQAKINRLFLITVAVLMVLLLSAMGTGLTVMFMRISALTEAAQSQNEDNMEEQFIHLEQQLLLLSTFRKKELTQIAKYTNQLKLIGSECSIEKAEPYNTFLISRETDFQQLINTITSGTRNLAGMNKGSKRWLESYTKNLEDLKQKSILRKKNLANLVAAKK